jgi:hypothetical protein
MTTALSINSDLHYGEASKANTGGNLAGAIANHALLGILEQSALIL